MERVTDAARLERAVAGSFGLEVHALDDEPIHDGWAVHAMSLEPGADLGVVRSAVLDQLIVIVQGEQVDGDRRADAGALVQGDGAQDQRADDVVRVRRLRNVQLLPDVPDDARDQGPAFVTITSTRGAARFAVLTGVVRGAQRLTLVEMDPDPHPRVLREEHRDGIRHALAIWTLPAVA